MREGSVARSSMMPRSRAGREGIGTGFGGCGSRGSGQGSVSGFSTFTIDVVLSGGGVLDRRREVPLEFRSLENQNESHFDFRVERIGGGTDTERRTLVAVTLLLAMTSSATWGVDQYSAKDGQMADLEHAMGRPFGSWSVYRGLDEATQYLDVVVPAFEAGKQVFLNITSSHREDSLKLP